MALSGKRTMKLGLFVQGAGHHIAGWRMPGAESGSENLDLIVRIARMAENAKFDMLFLADGLTTSKEATPSVIARFEPITLLAALAMATERIGLAVTASTTYYEPFNLARLLASVDLISRGRVAWNMVTTSSPEAAANFSGQAHLEHGLRYERAEEFVEVVLGLWDSWEPGAYVADKPSGVYMDSSKLHELNHRGRYFSVKGPLNITPSAQGRPVLIQAGSSGAGMKFAARYAETVFTAQQTAEEAAKFYAELKGMLPAYGRSADSCHILPGLLPIVGATEKEAREKHEHLQNLIDDSSAYAVLSERFHYDMRQFDLDRPVPDIPETPGHQSRPQLLLRLAREKGYTLRELYREVAGARGHRIVVGTPVQLADHMQHWFDSHAADGFNIMPPYVPDALADFANGVIPELQNRGLFREEYEGVTLREHLKLKVPANRYSQGE